MPFRELECTNVRLKPSSNVSSFYFASQIVDKFECFGLGVLTNWETGISQVDVIGKADSINLETFRQNVYFKVTPISRVSTAPTFVSDALQDFGLTDERKLVALPPLWLIVNLRPQLILLPHNQQLLQPQQLQPRRQPHRHRLKQPQCQCHRATVLRWKLLVTLLNIRALDSLCVAKASDSSVTAALVFTSRDRRQDAFAAKILTVWLTQIHARPTAAPTIQLCFCLTKRTVKGNWWSHCNYFFYKIFPIDSLFAWMANPNTTTVAIRSTGTRTQTNASRKKSLHAFQATHCQKSEKSNARKTPKVTSCSCPIPKNVNSTSFASTEHRFWHAAHELCFSTI